MSTAMETLVARVLKANAHQPEAFDYIERGLWMVYRGMRKKGYTDERAVEEAWDFYLAWCKTATEKIVRDGQHR